MNATSPIFGETLYVLHGNIHDFTWAEHGDFDVAVVGNDGARQTMLGFKTYAAAAAWVAEDEQRANEEIQSSSRMQWRF